MLDFAMKVAQQAKAVDEADSAALREHGFSDDDIWDMAAVAAFFGMSNRLANFTSLRPNNEFYALVHDQGSCCASGGRSWHW